MTTAATEGPAAGSLVGARVVRFLLTLVITLAASVLLVGWAAGAEALVRLHPAYPAMMPSTAVALLLISAAMLRHRRAAEMGRTARVSVWTAAAAAAVIASGDIAATVLGLARSVDTLIWPQIARRSTDAVSTATALCLLLAAGGVATLARPAGRWADGAAVTALTVGLLLALVAVVGYLFDADALYRVSFFTAMALHTALAFAALFVAMLVLLGARGWMAILMGPEPGSAGARRLLPAVVLIPILLCYAALRATEGGMMDADFRLSLLAILTVTLLAATVLRNAALENRASRAMAQITDSLRVAVNDKQLLLREVYHRVKNNLQQINALLMIEARQVEDPKAKLAFRATASRIVALSRVHTLMMSTPEPSRLGVRTFLQDLCGAIGDGAAVGLTYEGPERTIDVDMAVTLGLLVNELVEQRTGASRVELRYVAGDAGDAFRLRFPDGGGGGRASGARARIVASLVRQLRGEITTDADGSVDVRLGGRT